MSTIRFKAINKTFERKPLPVEVTSKRSEIFGTNVFNEMVMRQVMSKEAYNNVISAIEGGLKIDRKLADEIASAMKNWAITKGYCRKT